ncbi:efflux RND transporter permease subunit [Leptospira noumeaensis]|uniref:Efflux RND transporter permease subunit n=1 Tax=Leptospira noumeaensis TaxID=2484964 RepID=A0A4R9IH90_9LEPT|nr:efflux RND transporter permease subunit [Leptospira noumeaensis]TGK87453.1 efflux RND transporter permease subunit [Leptospira noumeaensis]
MSVERYVDFLIQHKRLCWVISLSFLIAVFFRIPELEIWLLPKLMPVKYFVVTEFPNHSAEDTDLMVSLPISEILSSVKSVERIRSLSEHGKSVVELDLLYGASLSEFKEQLYQTIFEIKDKLPPGVGVSRLFEGEREERPFMEILIPKPLKKKLDDYDFHLKQLQFQLERIPGITEVRMVGKAKESSFISIDPKILDLFPLTIRELESQIQSGKEGGSLGKIDGYTKDSELKFSSEITSHDDLNKFPIHLEGGKSVPLGQLTKIFKSELPEEKITRINGKDTIYLSIFSDSKTNPLRLSSEVQKKLNHFNMFAANIYSDVSVELRTALRQFVMSLLWGLLFAFLFSYLLYKSWIPALLLLVAVSFSFVLFFHLILFFSISINLLSLGGISVGAGMLFDASNLTVFSIRRQILMGDTTSNAINKGIKSVLVSLFSSSLTTIVVFIPLLVFPMEWKDFLFDSGINIALLVFCSFISSLWMVPLLAVSLRNFPKDNQNILKQETFVLGWYEKTYQFGKHFNLRWFAIGFMFFFVFGLITLGSKLEIFPKQESIGIRLQTLPKNGLSFVEELTFVNDLEVKIKSFDSKISVLVFPIQRADYTQTHPKKAIPIQWELNGVEHSKELQIFLSNHLSSYYSSHWDWKWDPIGSEVTKVLPFLPDDKIVFLNKSWDLLQSFSYEWKNRATKLGLTGEFSFLPKQILLEEWTRQAIPIPELLPLEGDLKDRILYEYNPKYLGEIGEGTKRDLYLGIGMSDFRPIDEIDLGRTGFKTKLNDLISVGSLFSSEKKTSYDQFRRESGLFYMEWKGELPQLDRNEIKKSGISFLEFSAKNETYHFFYKLLLLFIISFAFIYLVLVGIYESFFVPIFYLGISIFYLLVTSSIVFILFDSFHLGHYIGLVVLLGLSIDNISLFGERWMELTKGTSTKESRETVFRWLVRPVSLNSGTTMMGFLPVLFLGFSGSEFSRSIALTMFVGIPISIFFVFYLYPVLFPKFLSRVR